MNSVKSQYAQHCSPSTEQSSQKSRSFENSYIPENPRTPKPLTFSKNRLRGAKNRSNISPVAKKNFRKNDFFFSKNFAYVQTFFLCICAQSLYNTYLKRFVKKNLKKNAKKKKLHICTKNKKKLHICKRFRSRFFEKNNGLGDIGNWGTRKMCYNSRNILQYARYIGNTDSDTDIQYRQAASFVEVICTETSLSHATPNLMNRCQPRKATSLGKLLLGRPAAPAGEDRTRVSPKSDASPYHPDHGGVYLPGGISDQIYEFSSSLCEISDQIYEFSSSLCEISDSGVSF
ncbi:hypothetical protein LXL04_020333 [Taraxacum kok-saghyz]